MIGRILFAITLVVLSAVPAGAIAQGGVEAGWAHSPASLDGIIGSAEWADATQVALTPSILISAPSPADTPIAWSSITAGNQDVSPDQVSGWARFMNDSRYLYIAVALDVGAPSATPDRALEMLTLWFEDEPTVGDGTWAASLCTQNVDEGYFESLYTVGNGTVDYNALGTLAEEGFCTYSQSPPGYGRAFGWGSANWEVRIDLGASALQAAPDDCVYLGVYVGSEEYFDQELRVSGAGEWPQGIFGGDKPDVLGEVCLAEEPMEEEFVPELGSLALLGSGLMGLAGYAGLRWRTRREA
jgi:hypothetical protein